MKYAEKTKVPIGRSKERIENLLIKSGIENFGYETNRKFAAIKFVYEGLSYMVGIKLQDITNEKFTHTSGGKLRKDKDSIFQGWMQEQKRLWRVLELVIKAKLELINEGGSSFEQEFLSGMLTRDGKPLILKLIPFIEQAKQTGQGLDLSKALPKPEL